LTFEKKAYIILSTHCWYYNKQFL